MWSGITQGLRQELRCFWRPEVDATHMLVGQPLTERQSAPAAFKLTPHRARSRAGNCCFEDQ